MERILVVEDERSIALVLRDVLDDEGYETRVAENGREALEVVPQFHPHLIISDIMMPFISGIELCRTLKADPSYRTIPIIFMTAGYRQQDIVDCEYEGFLVKPFELAAMLTLVASILDTPRP